MHISRDGTVLVQYISWSLLVLSPLFTHAACVLLSVSGGTLKCTIQQPVYSTRLYQAHVVQSDGTQAL